MNLRSILKKSKDLQSIYDYLKVKWYILDRKPKISTYFEKCETPKLHLGCGNNILNNWLNSDYSKPNRKTIFLDVTRKFPFPNNSFYFVLAEHLVEHVHYFEAKHMLSEVYRVLKPGGILRISTPDVDKYIHLYQNFNYELENTIVRKFTDDWIFTGFHNAKNYVPEQNYYQPIFFLNDVFMNYEHKFIYNEKELIHILSASGFTNCKICEPGKSNHPELEGVETHTDTTNAYITLTIECKKE